MILIDNIDNKVVMQPPGRGKPIEFTRDEAIDLAARLLDRALRCQVVTVTTREDWSFGNPLGPTSKPAGES